MDIWASLLAQMNTVVQAFDDCLFPPHCLLSGKPLTCKDIAESRIPGILNSALDAIMPALPSAELLAFVERHFGTDELFLSNVHALWRIEVDSDIDRALYAMKYAGRRRLAHDLGVELGKYLADYVYSEADLTSIRIQPIPIHKARLRERGYNQAELIAQGVASGMRLGPEAVATFVSRRSYTGTQTELRELDRIANVQGAFQVAKSDEVQGATVLLIDDVLTTGSTLNAAALSLIEAGARRADAATLCMAM